MCIFWPPLSGLWPVRSFSCNKCLFRTLIFYIGRRRWFIVTFEEKRSKQVEEGERHILITTSSNVSNNCIKWPPLNLLTCPKWPTSISSHDWPTDRQSNRPTDRQTDSPAIFSKNKFVPIFWNKVYQGQGGQKKRHAKVLLQHWKHDSQRIHNNTFQPNARGLVLSCYCSPIKGCPKKTQTDQKSNMDFEH